MKMSNTWKITDTGTYEEGRLFGRAIAVEFLRHMGSGKVKIRNNALADMLVSWEKLYGAETCLKAKRCLDGQKDGFLGRLSEFITGAAFVTNCGLSEENDFNPARICEPQGLENTL